MICNVTGQQYASLLQQSVIPAPQSRRWDGITVFIQDGAPTHIAHRVKQVLRCHFGDDTIISLHFSAAWPPRSSELNACDFYLWRYLKAMVNRYPITSLSELKEIIKLHVRNIPHFMLLSTIEHAILCFQMAADNGKQHIEHVF
ncbi:uncharacterized protein TNCV_2706671 [Trichonephila clavipes]|nr:uncharacterized protein TNCV_2706671 [Trichonephila clavipes]